MPALGPVFRHEMIAAGRKTRYFWIRALVGAAMLAVLALIYAGVSAYEQSTLSIRTLAEITSAFYTSAAWLTMGAVLAVTPVVAAGAIATERERRTIEYLFATDLSNAEIVLDKLLARLLTVGKIVLAAAPVLAIFRLLGGVPGELLLAHAALLATTGALVASYALLTGAYHERARDAAQRAISGTVAFLILPGFLLAAGAFLSPVQRPWVVWLSEWVLQPVTWFLLLINPVAAMIQGGGLLGGNLGVDFDSSVVFKTCGAQLGVTAVLLAVAVATVRRTHLAAAGAPGHAKKAAGKKGAAASATRSPYELRPVLWKEMYAASLPKKRGAAIRHRVGVGVLVIAIAATLVGVIASGYLFGGRVDFEDYMLVACGLATAVGSVVVLAMGARAAGLVSYERERETWLSLLTTPLTGAEIVAGKMGGNFYNFRWGLAGAVAIPLTALIYSPVAIPAALGFALSLGIVSLAATAVGLAASLRIGSSIKAVGVTIAIMLAISAVYPVLLGMLTGILTRSDLLFELFGLPAVAPVLLAVPMLLAAEGPPDDEILFAYAGGTLFYVALGAAVTAANIRHFDRICGRATRANPAAASRPPSGPDQRPDQRPDATGATTPAPA
ncbi:ABC transporter permease subunit [Botrimarina sp.]|uniref:ABC transporter permease n=1 Tax=Botrimarina sp. TaxID=2795802 RepID=UPI0032EEB3CC